jgi:hypothetical protein
MMQVIVQRIKRRAGNEEEFSSKEIPEKGSGTHPEQKFITASMPPYQFYLTVSLEETLQCSNASDA